MRQKSVIARQKGRRVAEQYEAYSLTAPGRLRHGLIFGYYSGFVSRHRIRWVVDIGGGSGILIRQLRKKFPKLNLVLIDDDEAMIAKARKNLFKASGSGRVDLIIGQVNDLPAVIRSLPIGRSRILVSCNHAIEYIPRQPRALVTMADSIPAGSFLGIMYLNNSHEAFRKIFFKDSISELRRQLSGRRLDMAYFGIGRAIETGSLQRILTGCGLKPIADYGVRCVSDFKSSEFLESHYNELRELELVLGALPDFRGLARYRLAFFAA